MRTLLIYVFALILVGGLLFLAASFAFGRDEEMAPALPDGTPVELPDDRPATGADLRALRLAVVLRGYRMEEVDWVLDRLAEQVDSRDREIARLRSVLHVEPMGAASDPARVRAGAGWGPDAGWVPDAGRGRAGGPALAADDERLTEPEAPLPERADHPAGSPPNAAPPESGDRSAPDDRSADRPTPGRRSGDGPASDAGSAPRPVPGDGTAPVPVRDRSALPGRDPVRGLRSDAPDRDRS